MGKKHSDQDGREKGDKSKQTKTIMETNFTQDARAYLYCILLLAAVTLSIIRPLAKDA